MCKSVNLINIEQDILFSVTMDYIVTFLNNNC